MANALYTAFKQAAYDGTGLNLGTADVRAILIDTGAYTVDLASHDFLDDVPAGARIATVALTGESWSGGVFDADDAVFTSVSGTTVEAVLLYIHTGVEGTSLLMAYIDTATGLVLTPNGGDVTASWNASGIFGL